MSHAHKCTGFDPKKIYMLGEKSSGLESRGILQNYEELKKSHLQSGTLFEDPLFVPNETELGEEVKLDNVEWLRPKEIRKNPIFIGEKEDRFDVNQGELGDCWFMAALADVTQNYKILERVVPSDQSFDKNYAGIFHFRFWQYGRWIDVVVDDRLPTRQRREENGEITRELVYVKSKDKNVFWTALLEKAYAKLYGSYKNLDGGFVSEALGDLTGGLTEIHKADQEHWNETLFEKMLESYQKKSFMGCAIMNGTRLALSLGLIPSHAYSITEVIEIRSRRSNVIKLLRIRNPWGRVEWTGNWNDRSELWSTIPDNIRTSLSVKIREDGEFWMEFKDFIKYFDILEICHRNQDFGMTHWNCFMLDGSWSVNRNNTKYLLSLKGDDNISSVKIGLMQKNRRLHHQDQLPIGFKIETFFQAERQPLRIQGPKEYLQVTGHVKLLNGNYLILPFVKGMDKRECEYLLRVYSTANFELKELDSQ
ncbi:calpain-A isoform X1 [Leptinotarsa decemlineata]|uniref:calpain-A isoform X1 n=1 Tax=Leptinotarsa decemlineata TaxID=7539 RepID=UPI003D30CC65